MAPRKKSIIKPRKARYTDEEIAAGLVALDLNKGNYLKTAKEINVPEGTIRYWEKNRAKEPEVAVERERISGSLANAFENSIRDALTEAKRKMKTASLGTINQHIATLTDKFQVLNDRPTDIQHVTGGGDSKLETLSQILTNASERKKAKETKNDD